MRSIEAEGATIDEAIANALATLRVDREQVEVEIISNAGRGLFGLGSRRARVRATVREPVARLLEAADANVPRETVAEPRREARLATADSSLGERARELLQTILDHLEVSATVEVDDRSAETVALSVTCDEGGVVIGHRGQNLDAIEYLLNRMLRQEPGTPRIALDVEGYRDRRQASLEQLAGRLAAKARDSGQPVAMDPLGPRERRIIHLALQDDPTVTTRSVGEGHYRYVEIIPNERPLRAHRREDRDR